MKRRLNHHPPSQMLRYEKRLKDKGFSLIAGVDESGRGPLAGPVVAASVILKRFDFKEAIDDSKRLSAKKREKAYTEIIRKAHVGIGIVDEKLVDKLNIYNATVKAMEEAIANLKVSPDYILIDGRVNIRTSCPKRCIKRGDSKSLSIAAASIIAKVTRDRIMEAYHLLYPQYGFSRHKGYGTRRHKAALKKYGPSSIHRRAFKPMRDTLTSTPLFKTQ